MTPKKLKCLSYWPWFAAHPFILTNNLRDCCGELHKLDVKGKVYRLTYILNKDTDIRVRTPVGYTDCSEVGETLGQGTSESGLISSASLSGGVTDYFTDSVEVHYASLKLGCCLFQDDISRMAENLKNVEEGNWRLEEFLTEYTRDTWDSEVKLTEIFCVENKDLHT